MKFREKWIVGVDEAGRGPLAGPVTVGTFGAKEKMGVWLLKNIFDNKLRDSKKLSEKKREEIYKKFQKLNKKGEVDFKVAHISNKVIDKTGISKSIKSGIKNCLQKLEYKNQIYNGAHCILRLDGSLKAPAEFINQKTIIKGDEKDIWIACASIIAKVSRDRLISKLAKKYPNYSLEIHKGYGTTLHRQLIQKHGPSNLHRVSFCSKI